MSKQKLADELEQTIDQAWTDLVDKDDRTSPEEHPDMALITAEELREFMERVAALRAAGSAEPVAWRRRRKGTIGNDGWIMCPLKPRRDSEFELQALGVIGTASHPAPAGSAAKHMQTGEYHNAHVLARDVHRWRQTWENQPAGSVESASHEEAQIGALLAMAKTEEADIDFLFSEIRPQIGGPADRNAIRSFRRRIIQVAASHTIHRAPAESVREVLVAALKIVGEPSSGHRMMSSRRDAMALYKLLQQAITGLSSTATPLQQAAETAAEPKNLPDNWDYMKDTNSVRCGGCLFRFGAEHPDSDGKWTCPNCGDGNGEKEAAAEPTREEIASIISGPICDSTKSEHQVMKDGRYAFCTQCGETVTKPTVSRLDALNKADSIIALSKPRGGTAAQGEPK